MNSSAVKIFAALSTKLRVERLKREREKNIEMKKKRNKI